MQERQRNIRKNKNSRKGERKNQNIKHLIAQKKNVARYGGSHH